MVPFRRCPLFRSGGYVNGDSPLFVMPRDPHQWGGAAALWVTVAGWAGAARRSGLSPFVWAPSGAMTEEQCLDATEVATPRTLSAGRGGALLRRVPPELRQMARDAVNFNTARRVPHPPLADSSVPFVWQHHELFHNTGTAVAQSHHIPRIEYVHAPVVWEARKWGVQRRVTGEWLVRHGEMPQMLSADLVACVSQEVVDEVVRLGVPHERTIVSPMAVDPERFRPDVDGSKLRGQLSDLGDFIFGWVGSFRPFHAIDDAVRALHRLRQSGCPAGLVLVGDGSDRPRIQQLVDELGVGRWVKFLGQCSNRDTPMVLASFDATVLTASPSQSFHYSPLKLREYMAMGRPVVAPCVGEMARSYTTRTNIMHYRPGDIEDLADQLGLLATDPRLAVRVGELGRRWVAEHGTWDVMLRDCLKRLGLTTGAESAMNLSEGNNPDTAESKAAGR